MREPIELDDDGEIKRIDKAYTLAGWIEILAIFKDNYGEDSYTLDAEHDIIYLPTPKYNATATLEIGPDSDDGERLQQLGCFWDGDLHRWCKYT